MTRLGAAIAVGIAVATSAIAQDHVLDLRFLELSDDGDRTYHNAVYSWSFGERLSLESFWLFLPQQDDYREPGLGLGYKLSKNPRASVTLIGYFASASDDDYFEPAVLVADTAGRLTASIFLLRYVPLGDQGIDQWLIDPVEVQYRVSERWSLGASGYFYRPRGGAWLRKLGPKIAFGDDLGSSEVAVRKVSTGGWEIQLRRVFVF